MVAKWEQERLFLDTRIFRDLPILSPAWDSGAVAHFAASDFVKVLDRCAEANVLVFGVEVFTAEGRSLQVNIPARAGDLTHVEFVNNISALDGLIFCASYGFDNASMNETSGTVIVAC